MDHERPSLSTDVIEDLCRRYREAEAAKAMHFDRCEVRFGPQAVQPDTDRKQNND